MSGTPLLDISDLTVEYATPNGPLRAVNDVSLRVDQGETLALVGESGSGKSTIAAAIVDLLRNEAATITGQLVFKGRDIVAASAEERRALNGKHIGIVFQDPFTSLNPSLTIGVQVAEPLIQHLRLSSSDAMQRAISSLGDVGLPDPASLVRAYPHQLSGGMQQRVLIATALVCNPELLILDEPTTALDVTVEAQILDLLDQLRKHRRLGMIYITHNLGVVSRIADRVCVLYAGQVLETGGKSHILGRPVHPYTKGLLASLPSLAVTDRAARLSAIPGQFPDLTKPVQGCVFAARCPFAEERCRTDRQEIVEADGRRLRCWKASALADTPWP
ncbi:MAG: ABC transporter ATP-binding protein, partial [Hyphomicrobiaceae bacterium]